MKELITECFVEGNNQRSACSGGGSLAERYGYSSYHILRDGIYRIEYVINGQVTRTFLFTRKATVQRFVLFEHRVHFFSTV